MNNTSTTLIPLTRGLYALIDTEDAERVNAYKWNARCDGGRLTYATSGTCPEAYLHRYIMNAQTGQVVDHINGDQLDNRKANLRVCTIGENSRNRKNYRKDAYKGVSLRKDTGKWRARLNSGGKCYFLGYFKTPEEAALAYDRAALEHFGEFARLNFPLGGEQGA